MIEQEAVNLLRAALDQYSDRADRDLRWSAVHSLGEKFAKHFTLEQMQRIAHEATDSSTINVVDKGWSGLKATDGRMWLA